MTLLQMKKQQPIYFPQTLSFGLYADVQVEQHPKKKKPFEHPSDFFERRKPRKPRRAVTLRHARSTIKSD